MHQMTATCPDCRTRCGHEELEHCAADGPRPEPASIHAMLLDAEIQLASGAELVAMRDDDRAQVRRCARLAGIALGAENDRLRKELAHAAQAHGANVRRMDDELSRRSVMSQGARS